MAGEGDFPARSAWLNAIRPKKRPPLRRSQAIRQPDATYKTVWNDWFFGATAGAYSVAADTTSWVITGTAASVEVGREVPAAGGSVSVSGTSASVRRGLLIAATSGSFATAGGASGLQSSRSLSAAAGSVATAGQDAAILLGRSIDPVFGSIAVDGSSAAIALSRAIAAGAGEFDALGLDSTLYALRRISAEPGVVAVDGHGATLVVAGQQQEGGGLPEWALAELRAPVKSDRKYRLGVDAGRFAIVGHGASVRSGRAISSHAQTFDALGAVAMIRVTRGIAADRGIVGVASCEIAVIHTTSPVARMRRRVAVLSAIKLAA